MNCDKLRSIQTRFFCAHTSTINHSPKSWTAVILAINQGIPQSEHLFRLGGRQRPQCIMVLSREQYNMHLSFEQCVPQDCAGYFVPLSCVICKIIKGQIIFCSTSGQVTVQSTGNLKTTNKKKNRCYPLYAYLVYMIWGMRAKYTLKHLFSQTKHKAFWSKFHKPTILR